MPGWLAPRCPLDTWNKTWTESRMLWLSEKLGAATLRRAEVLPPTVRAFKVDYRGRGADAEALFREIGARMGLDPTGVRLIVTGDDEMPGAQGLYEPDAPGTPVVRVAGTLLSEPERLVATLAHELAHHLLMGRNLISIDETDFEWVTDLAPVAFGLGLFAANTTILERQWTEGKFSHFEARQNGYLSSLQFGYAHALFALLRGEESPPWGAHLRPDAAESLRLGLRYLRRGGPCLIDPNRPRTGRPRSPHELAEALRDPVPTYRLAAVWEVRDRKLVDPVLLPGLEAALDDPDRWVRPDAAGALAGFGKAAAGAVPALIRASRSRHDETRADAVAALGAIADDPAATVPALADRLDDPSRRVVSSAARALGRFGDGAAPATPQLLRAFRKAVVDCLDDAADLAESLLAVHGPDKVVALVRSEFADDPEIVVRALDELDPPPDDEGQEEGEGEDAPAAP